MTKKNETWTACANQNKSVKKTANITFGGFFNANKVINSKMFQKSLEFASDNGALFAAGIATGWGVALYLCGLLPPAGGTAVAAGGNTYILTPGGDEND